MGKKSMPNKIGKTTSEHLRLQNGTVMMGSRGHTSEVKSRKSYLAQHAISNRLKNGSASSSKKMQKMS